MIGTAAAARRLDVDPQQIVRDVRWALIVLAYDPDHFVHEVRTHELNREVQLARFQAHPEAFRDLPRNVLHPVATDRDVFVLVRRCQESIRARPAASPRDSSCGQDSDCARRNRYGMPRLRTIARRTAASLSVLPELGIDERRLDVLCLA